MVVLVVVVLVVDVVGGTVVDEGATVVDVRDALGVQCDFLGHGLSSMVMVNFSSCVAFSFLRQKP